MSKPERFTNATGAPVPDNTNILGIVPEYLFFEELELTIKRR